MCVCIVLTKSEPDYPKTSHQDRSGFICFFLSCHHVAVACSQAHMIRHIYIPFASGQKDWALLVCHSVYSFESLCFFFLSAKPDVRAEQFAMFLAELLEFVFNILRIAVFG